MAKIHQTATTKKTKTRYKKGQTKTHAEYIKCSICGGKGYLKNWRLNK